MVMRLRGRPPHEEWPVPYPYECPPEEKCPSRKIDDIENYLISLITQAEPPPLMYTGPVPPIRPIYDVPIYMDRHVYVHEPDPDIEDDVRYEYPAVWVPPQVRGWPRGIGWLVRELLEKQRGREVKLTS